MSKLLKATGLMISLLGLAGLAFAAPISNSYIISASIPADDELNIGITKVEGTTETTETAINFGELTFDSDLGIYLPSCYYYVDASVTSNATNWTLAHTATTLTNGADNLDGNVKVTFVKKNSSGETDLDVTNYADSNGITYAKSTFAAGDWLKVYYGIATTSDTTIGLEPVGLDKTPGSYSGQVTYTLTPNP